MLPVAVGFYDASVAIHVMAAIVAFGPLFAFPLFISVTERRDLLSLPVVLRAVNRTERAIVVPVGALVGFTGVYLAIDGPYTFDDDVWMTIGFVLYLLVFGVLVLRGRADAGAGRRRGRPDARRGGRRRRSSCRSRTPTAPGCGCRTR